MIIAKFNDRKLIKDLNNIVAYSNGFLEGAKIGKPIMLKNLGIRLKTLAGEYIDSSARVNPTELQHVYEWYQVGSSEARLFDLDYVIVGNGLTMSGTLTQSTSIANGSKEPFYNKARIMEDGIPITISPKNSEVLVFEDNGSTVFTRKPITVDKPGGEDAQGSFHAIFREFFTTYLSQSLLDISGMSIHLNTAKEYKNSFSAGKNGGRSVGIAAGTKYISGGVSQ